MNTCRRGCCWNPWSVCGRMRKCKCHGPDGYDTLTAHQLLENFLDSLGDE